jgi:hypothetical protein
MLNAREFLGDEFWKSCKTDYDLLMAYRKTLKGKPDDFQRLTLDLNKIFIDFYGTLLFHGDSNPCQCRYCSQKREQL